MKHKRVPPPRPIYYHQFTLSDDECWEIIEELRDLRLDVEGESALSIFYKKLSARNL